jgi:hypothetical protein
MTDREIANLVEWIERLSIVETKIERLPAIEAKLDELIALRHKGLGAFWLASSLIGTGIMGAIFTFIDWIKGAH